MKLLLTTFTVLLLLGCDRSPKDAKRVYMMNHSAQRVVYLSSNSYPDTINFEFNGCPTTDIEIMVLIYNCNPISGFNILAIVYKN